MQQCCKVSVLAESVAERQKENKEEKKAQPNLYTMHTKCVITIPKNVQLTHSTCGETHDELLGLIGDDDLQQMKPSLSLLNMMLSSLMILKDKSKEEKMAAPHRNSMPSI